MNCKNIKNILKNIDAILMTDYIDGELSPEKLKIVDEHLSSCSDCLRFKENLLKNTVKPFGGLQNSVPPASVWQGVRAGITEKRGSGASFFPAFMERLTAYPALSAATAAIAVFLVSSFLFMGQPDRSALNTVDTGMNEYYFSYVYEGLDITDDEHNASPETYFYS